MDFDINEVRQNFDKLGSKYEVADNVTIEKEIIQGITCYWFFTTGNKSSSNINIYLHGGCFALGSINSHKAMVSHLAKETDSTVLFIEYSLAPEHPFPTAIIEILKVYNYLVDEMRINRLSFWGDSAGGGLAISVISVINREFSKGVLHQVVMISPWLDLRNINNSVFKNKDIDPILTKESLDLFASLYVGKNLLSAVNPIDAPLSSFPPTLILVGTNEILLDDSRTLFSIIQPKQPLAKLVIAQNQTHVWLTDDIHSEAAKKAVDEIKRFLIASNK